MYNNVNGYTGPDSYLLDPLFVKPVSFTGIPKNAAEEAELLAADYHLKPNSPLIDAGKTVSKSDMLATLRDAEGNPRIQGNAIDIGCYEAPKANGSVITSYSIHYTKLYEYVPINNQSEYIFGIQGMNQQNSNFNHRETILLPDASTNNYGAFGLLQYKLWHKLNIQTGLRYDNKSIHTQTIGIPAEATYRPAIDKQFGSFSGSLGATYTINEALLVRTNFAAAYRTPNIAELTSNGRHELRFEKGDANLVPEKAYESDLSLHYP